jgi:ATP-dependent Clp protease ATP-binding subunit ClpA
VTATTAAAAIVRGARGEARAIGSSAIGQEHLILGLSAHPDSVAGRALAQLGIDAATIKTGLLSMVGTPPAAGRGEPAPTPRLLRALEEADAEAGERGRPTTSADLLLGILRTHQGVGFQLLGYAGIGEEKLRAAVADVVTGHAELDAVEEGAAPSFV